MIQGDIIKLALSRVGETESNPTRIAKLEQLYTFGKKILIGSFAWSFCKNILAIVPNVDVTPTYKYTYQLPNDYGRLIDVLPETDYDIIGGKLVSNNLIQYIVISDYSLIIDTFPSLFADCLATWIAKEYVLSLPKPELYDGLNKLFQLQYDIAKAGDSANNAPIELTNTYLQTRQGGGNPYPQMVTS